MKAGFNHNDGSWNTKYEYKSRRKPLISSTFKHDRDMPADILDVTSDYGTMSNQVEEQHQFDDNVPPLNLVNGRAGVFSEISVQDRRDRIDSIVREIKAVPKLSEAIITQRSQRSNDKLRKFVSNENLSNRQSAMSGRITGQNSRLSSRGQSQTRKNVANSKENSAGAEQRKKFSATNIKRPVIPDLNLSKLNRTQTYDERSVNLSKAASRSKISSTTLNESVRCSQQSLDSQNFLPNVGEDTQNELLIVPPTMGDDTLESNSCQTLDITHAKRNDDEKDFVKKNITDSAKVSGRRKENDKPVNTVTHRSGVVPKYLKDRQKHWRDEAQAIIDNAPDPDCPPGHHKLSDEERTSQLQQMKVNQQQLLLQLNRMPVSSDTMRVMERKRELENQLTKLEENIRVFSRPKVFVPEHNIVQGS